MKNTFTVPPQLEPLIDGVKRLYASEDTDLVITCKGQEWKVHKFCLCAQSDFFQSTCAGGFKEAKENKIDLDDDDPQVVEAFIHYLYNFDYGEYTNRQTDVVPIVLDVRMYAIAEKYFVAPLKKLAADKFETRAQTEWNTPSFADAAAEVYDSTADRSNPIKHTIINIVKKHSNELLNKSKGHAQFLKVLSATTDFGADVSVALATTIPAKFYKCPNCEHLFSFSKTAPGEFRCPFNCHSGDEKFWDKYLVMNH